MDKTVPFESNHIACTYAFGTKRRRRKSTRNHDKISQSLHSLRIGLYSDITDIANEPKSSCPMMSDVPGVPLPEYKVLSQKLNETGIEMCEDMLHLCPATADCCKKEDGKWDCCPKQAAIGGTVMFPDNNF
ncbi:hypothetical protein CEXT_439001 [Caerostris extrusa]|uniref:Granulins domain-containing protein n=1 Tax=Caerostris extrusa TaxID=172846 RepID=A0AAV4NX96_CAEEX|nr:hypothetical protein CEXT_439001 [Caerostris extrusa]